jgi:hypothetical protein
MLHARLILAPEDTERSVICFKPRVGVLKLVIVVLVVASCYGHPCPGLLPLGLSARVSNGQLS